MNLDDLSNLNKEFAQMSGEMHDEFISLFQKWMQISPRLTVVNVLGLHLNIIINLIRTDTHNKLYHIIPELPDIFMRYAYPFVKIKQHWGKVSGEEFVELYGREHEKLFDKVFNSEEDKDIFKKWFETDTKKHEKGKSK